MRGGNTGRCGGTYTSTHARSRIWGVGAVRDQAIMSDRLYQLSGGAAAQLRFRLWLRFRYTRAPPHNAGTYFNRSAARPPPLFSPSTLRLHLPTDQRGRWLGRQQAARRLY